MSANIYRRVEQLERRLSNLERRHQANAVRFRPLEGPITAEALTEAYGAYTARAIVLAAEAFATTPEEVLGKGRHPNITAARYVAMRVIADDQRLRPSTVTIGRIFSGRHHTSVIHALRKVRNNPKLANQALAIRAQINAEIGRATKHAATAA